MHLLFKRKAQARDKKNLEVPIALVIVEAIGVGEFSRGKHLGSRQLRKGVFLKEGTAGDKSGDKSEDSVSCKPGGFWAADARWIWHLGTAARAEGQQA